MTIIETKSELISKYHFYRAMVKMTKKNIGRTKGEVRAQQEAQLERLKKEWMDVYVKIQGF